MVDTIKLFCGSQLKNEQNKAISSTKNVTHHRSCIFIYLAESIKYNLRLLFDWPVNLTTHCERNLVYKNLGRTWSQPWARKNALWSTVGEKTFDVDRTEYSPGKSLTQKQKNLEIYQYWTVSFLATVVGQANKNISLTIFNEM